MDYLVEWQKEIPIIKRKIEAEKGDRQKNIRPLKMGAP